MISIRRSRALTFIELAIVITVVLTLALAGIMAYGDMRLKSRITVLATDFHTLSQSLELYRISNRIYPDNTDQYGNSLHYYGLYLLTTPIAYQMEIPNDIFGPASWVGNNEVSVKYYIYNPNFEKSNHFLLASCGPDKNFDDSATYDVTNGLQSFGDIYNRKF